MTKGEAMALETDMNIFQMKLEKETEEIVSATEHRQIIITEETKEINLQSRFARLKKSLRKRSASIL